jgi:hypothetical protein
MEATKFSADFFPIRSSWVRALDIEAIEVAKGADESLD